MSEARSAQPCTAEVASRICGGAFIAMSVTSLLEWLPEIVTFVGGRGDIYSPKHCWMIVWVI